MQRIRFMIIFLYEPCWYDPRVAITDRNAAILANSLIFREFRTA
ncbi:hypothetical protein MKY63_23705 [Paenibacillus sp. FSL R7-0189]